MWLMTKVWREKCNHDDRSYPHTLKTRPLISKIPEPGFRPLDSDQRRKGSSPSRSRTPEKSSVLSGMSSVGGLRTLIPVGSEGS